MLTFKSFLQESTVIANNATPSIQTIPPGSHQNYQSLEEKVITKTHHTSYEAYEKYHGGLGNSGHQTQLSLHHKAIAPLHHLLAKHYTFDPIHHQEIVDHMQDAHYNRELNSYHWKTHHGTQPTPDEIKHHQKYTHIRDAHINKHTTPTHFTVYSGLPKHPVFYTHNQKIDKHGTTFQHPAYLHTTLSKHDAWPYATNKDQINNGKHVGPKTNNHTVQHHHYLKIEVPKGRPGAYVGHIPSKHENPKSKSKGHNIHGDEFQYGYHEFILPRNTKLKIHPKPETHIRSYSAYNHHVGHYTREEHHHFWHTTIEE